MSPKVQSPSLRGAQSRVASGTEGARTEVIPSGGGTLRDKRPTVGRSEGAEKRPFKSQSCQNLFDHQPRQRLKFGSEREAQLTRPQSPPKPARGNVAPSCIAPALPRTPPMGSRSTIGGFEAPAAAPFASPQIELLWALARSQQRRRTLEEELRGLQGVDQAVQVCTDDRCSDGSLLVVGGGSDMAVNVPPLPSSLFGGERSPSCEQTSMSEGDGGDHRLSRSATLPSLYARRACSPQRQKLALAPSQSAETNDFAADEAALLKQLQGLPNSAAAQLRTGFRRLYAELKLLRDRFEQQQIVHNQLVSKLDSREALESRLSALQSEKDTFTELCRMRNGLQSGSGLAPVVDRNGFVAASLREAHSVALELVEQQRMIEEDALSERTARLSRRVTPSQRCEQLCRELHRSEAELQATLQEERRLEEILSAEQHRLAAREGKETKHIRGAELRLLHQKMKLFRLEQESRKYLRDEADAAA